MVTIQGFSPIADVQAHILLLGSMPSAASLAKQQYYAHPRNAFWPIMGALYGAYPELEYAQRTRILRRHGVAVWDVLASCRRQGSADQGIAKDSLQINDFVAFFQQYRFIRQVFFNGGTAEAVYNKHILSTLHGLDLALRYHRLPSTSPAFASMNLQQKIAAWRAITNGAGY